MVPIAIFIYAGLLLPFSLQPLSLLFFGYQEPHFLQPLLLQLFSGNENNALTLFLEFNKKFETESITPWWHELWFNFSAFCIRLLFPWMDVPVFSDFKKSVKTGHATKDYPESSINKFDDFSLNTDIVTSKKKFYGEDIESSMSSEKKEFYGEDIEPQYPDEDIDNRKSLSSSELEKINNFFDEKSQVNDSSVISTTENLDLNSEDKEKDLNTCPEEKKEKLLSDDYNTSELKELSFSSKDKEEVDSLFEDQQEKKAVSSKITALEYVLYKEEPFFDDFMKIKVQAIKITRELHAYYTLPKDIDTDASYTFFYELYKEKINNLLLNYNLEKENNLKQGILMKSKLQFKRSNPNHNFRIDNKCKYHVFLLNGYESGKKKNDIHKTMLYASFLHTYYQNIKLKLLFQDTRQKSSKFPFINKLRTSTLNSVLENKKGYIRSRTKTKKATNLTPKKKLSTLIGLRNTHMKKINCFLQSYFEAITETNFTTASEITKKTPPNN